jgi:hypothetical protein
LTKDFQSFFNIKYYLNNPKIEQKNNQKNFHLFYLVLRKFVVGFWKRKHNREVKPPDDQINNFTSKEILVKFPLKSALIYCAFIKRC